MHQVLRFEVLISTYIAKHKQRRFHVRFEPYFSKTVVCALKFAFKENTNTYNILSFSIVISVSFYK